MAYSKALNEAQKKYVKSHFKSMSIKIPLEMYDRMCKCARYENNMQFIRLLIKEEIERDNKCSITNDMGCTDDSANGTSVS